MSQENVEAHKRAIDAFNRRDLDTILAQAPLGMVWRRRSAQNDTDGSVLSAQPDKSQGRPLSSSGSQPIR